MQLRQLAHQNTARAAPEAAATERGGPRWLLTQLSVIAVAAVFMGVDPSTVSTSLAGTFRALNSFLPAHLDPDALWWVANIYMRGLGGPSMGEPMGCRLFMADGRVGGEVVEVATDPGDPHVMLQVNMQPA